ncbi:aryl-alcohol dehydrogenase [Russula aff. rugulosa BPL654]|nr:aryl-alcohol dehydrogenase [Russula aff. rugulosa BPL654]
MSVPTVTKRVTYVRLGKSGLKVSRIILGMMSYGDSRWLPCQWVLGEKEAIEHVKFAYEHGVNTFDTANSYSNGVSEVCLGRAIKALDLPREEIVVMTKVFGTVGKSFDVSLHNVPPAEKDRMGYVNQYGLSRKHIFDSVKKSLERLQLDYIDVLQCHRFDPDTPIEETMRALHDVVKAGYVRYIGMSNCYAWQVKEEREMFPTLKHFGVARGLLTRPFDGERTTKRGDNASTFSGYLEGPGTLEIVKRVEEISKKRGISMAQVSLAWSLTRVTAPIVGSTSIEKLEDLINGVDVKLAEEDILYLEVPYKARSVMGH